MEVDTPVDMEFRVFLRELREARLRDMPRLVTGTRINLLSRAFHHACVYGDTRIVQVMLQDGRVDPSAWQGMYLHSACMGGHVEIVQLLLDDGRVECPELIGAYRHEVIVELLLSRMDKQPIPDDLALVQRRKFAGAVHTMLLRGVTTSGNSGASFMPVIAFI